MSYPASVNDSFYSAMSFRQKCISEAHIRAICASLGCSISSQDPDDDKIDFIIGSKVKGSFINSPRLDIQSKCKLADGPIQTNTSQLSYTVDLSLYNKLRDIRVAAPIILVLTLVPRETKSWINYSHKETKLSFCSYWVSLRGFPALAEGQKSKTIEIPTQNVFSADFLHKAMQSIADADSSFLCGETP
jgi:hypothetical protein